MKPRRVPVFIEKTRDGQVLPVRDVEIVDVACGASHTVSVHVLVAVKKRHHINLY